MDTKPIKDYITQLNTLYLSGNATEHSYRTAIKEMLESILTGLQIINEPKRKKYGAPDFLVTASDIPRGYIETKDIGKSLDSPEYEAQFKRYKEALNNLIITDYLYFEHYVNGEKRETVRLGKVIDDNITIAKDSIDSFISFIDYFGHIIGDSIQNSEDLAEFLSKKARFLAFTIENTLKNEAGSKLASQWRDFQKVLKYNLDAKEFSDMYAQTIAYGMFAAKLNDKRPNEPFTRQKAGTLIPVSNSFLRRFFQYLAGYDLDESISWIVDDVANVFDHTNAEEIKSEFRKAGGDPFIHFYETFLSKYAPEMRQQRGVFYTPEPIVQFIVKAVDDTLVDDFHIEHGLADNHMVNGHHRVQILDPATGTGTFLAEVINSIYKRFSNTLGQWKGYVTDHLLPRLNGFEVMMAPYTMAHLKIDMQLKETGFDNENNENFKIFLSNSLEILTPKQNTLEFYDFFRQEIDAANVIKNDTPLMVVLGNPPYFVKSMNTGKWINDLMKPYKLEPTGEPLKERQKRQINDDYIKFIRLGEHFIERRGEGIVAYITNHGFIDNIICRGIRWHLLKTFDKIYILDLHGNARKREMSPDGSRDENVFNIQQGVSINIFVKTSNTSKKLADVFHYDLFGSRQKKYKFLLSHTLKNVNWNILSPVSPSYFFIPKDFSQDDNYNKGFSVKDLFVLHRCGITTSSDKFVIDDKKDVLLARFKDFQRTDPQKEDLSAKFSLDMNKWEDMLQGWRNIKNKDDLSKYIYPLAYRPFDDRFIFYENKLVHRRLYEVMQHYQYGENIGLMVCRQHKSTEYKHCLIHTKMVESSYVSNKTSESGYTFPLFRITSSDGHLHKEPNLNKKIVDNVAKTLGLSFSEIKTTNSFSALDLLDYIYAILYHPIYRTRYSEQLKIDFPKVPYPTNADIFWAFANIGSTLRKLHLMESVEPAENIANFPIPGTDIVETVEYKEGKAYINKTQYFDNVPIEAWDFYIGSYQPAQKWLKDRQFRKLNYDSLEHYQKIIYVLKKTDEIMDEMGSTDWL